MEVTITPLLSKILNDKDAKKQLAQSLVNSDKTITINDKTYKLERI